MSGRILPVLRKLAARLLLLAFSLLVALLLMEVLLRVIGYSPAVMGPLNGFHQADPDLGWVGIPNHSARFKTLQFDAKVTTNENGFREVTTDVVPEKDAPEVWLLGDSTTWGWGVSNGELFADVLQEKVGPEIQIRNFGMNAYGTLQESILFERLLEEREAPAKVIVLVCSNDFSDNLTDQGGARPYLERAGANEPFKVFNRPVKRKIGGLTATIGRKSYACGFLFYGARLFKTFRHRAKYGDTTAEQTEASAKRPSGVSTSRVDAEPFDALQFAMRKIDTLCARNGTSLTVISFPSVSSPYVKPSQSVALDEICENLPTAESIDIESKMAENRQEYYIGSGDFHWNAAGNRKAAEVIVERLGPGLGLRPSE